MEERELKRDRWMQRGNIMRRVETKKKEEEEGGQEESIEQE